MKVLLIAYACDREDVSETFCSYEWTRHLAALHDATVLAYNRSSRYGAARRQLGAARVLEWREPALFERLGTFGHAVKPGYLDFYRRARAALRRLLAAERFDLIHQFEPFAPRYPSPAAGLGVPFVLGPVGGGVDTPPGFCDELDAGMPWFTRLRGLDRLRFRRDPWLRHTYASADLVLGIAPYVRELLAPVPLRRFAYMHETGVAELPPAIARPAGATGALRLLYVGRVVRAKGVRDAVRALAQLADLPGVTLDVVGEGDDRAACQREARQLGVAARVRFHGWLDRAGVASCYARADAFLFPSLREASGSVVIEALSHGLPVVAAARGGPGFTVDASCGLTVPADTPRQYATALAEAVRALAARPHWRAALGRAARARVAEQFLWPRKALRMTALYEEVVAAVRGGLSHAA